MRIFIFILSITFFFTPLLKAEEKGSIKVYCDKGFKISLDGEYKGECKRKKKSVFIQDVLYGNHVLEFIKKGYVSDTIHITLSDSILMVDINKIITDRNIFAIRDFTNSKDRKYDRDEYLRILKLEADSTIPEFITSEELIHPSSDLMPSMIREEKPVYPENLMKSNKSGTVYISALVGTDGDVIKVIVSKKSEFPEFDESARVVASKNKFIPAVLNDKRISAWVTYKVEFKLIS